MASRPSPAASSPVPPQAAPAAPLFPPRSVSGAHAQPQLETAPAAPKPTPSRAPINPFLANDPNAKAKRLARALVSDLVTYFPEKREQGLREGTLKQLFKEEIQKSFEEYVGQVGRELAETTTHFQEALNDILAGGPRLF